MRLFPVQVHFPSRRVLWLLVILLFIGTDFFLGQYVEPPGVLTVFGFNATRKKMLRLWIQDHALDAWQHTFRKNLHELRVEIPSIEPSTIPVIILGNSTCLTAISVSRLQQTMSLQGNWKVFSLCIPGGADGDAANMREVASLLPPVKEKALVVWTGIIPYRTYLDPQESAEWTNGQKDNLWSLSPSLDYYLGLQSIIHLPSIMGKYVQTNSLLLNSIQDLRYYLRVSTASDLPPPYEMQSSTVSTTPWDSGTPLTIQGFVRLIGIIKSSKTKNFIRWELAQKTINFMQQKGYTVILAGLPPPFHKQEAIDAFRAKFPKEDVSVLLETNRYYEDFKTLCVQSNSICWRLGGNLNVDDYVSLAHFGASGKIKIESEISTRLINIRDQLTQKQ